MPLAGELYRDALAQALGKSGLTDKIDAFATWLDQQQRLVSASATLFSGSEIVKSLLVRDNLSSTIFNSSSGWQIKGNGAATFRSITAAGSITATSGAIGGWTLGATALTAGTGATSVGMDSGGTNPAFYAGSATPGSAPFRVTQAGVLTATSATITGSVTMTGGSLLINSGGADRISLQSDGDAFFGSNIGAAATTSFSIFSNAQTYNSESMGAGDVLFGDNSSGKPNLLWDVSAGKILTRSGAVAGGEISGGIAMSYGAFIYRNDQSIPNSTDTTVRWGVESYDDASFFQLTTNYCLNPSFEVNVTDDWIFTDSGAGASANLDAAQYKIGAKSCRIRAGTSAASQRTTTGVSVPNGATVAISAWVRCSADPTGNKAYIQVYDNIGLEGHAFATAASNGAWEYLTATCVNTSGGARTFYFYGVNFFADSATDVWFDACQLELASAATTYCDGSLSDCNWDGTAHNSVSQRTGITIPANLGGTYLIGAYAAFDPNVTGIRGLFLMINGASPYNPATYANATSAGVSWLTATHERALSGGDVVKLCVNQTSGGALNFGGNLWFRKVR